MPVKAHAVAHIPQPTDTGDRHGYGDKAAATGSSNGLEDSCWSRQTRQGGQTIAFAQLPGSNDDNRAGKSKAVAVQPHTGHGQRGVVVHRIVIDRRLRRFSCARSVLGTDYVLCRHWCSCRWSAGHHFRLDRWPMGVRCRFRPARLLDADEHVMSFHRAVRVCRCRPTRQRASPRPQKRP